MAAEYNLIVDSCCELPRVLWDRDDIIMLHFSYLDGDESHIDDLFESITPHDFYNIIRKGGTPSTSQPSQAEFEDAFRRCARMGRAAVYLAFSSGISGAYDGACVALDRVRREYPDGEFYVLDLKIGSTPQSLLISEAIRHKDRGLSAKELYEWADEARYYVQTIFMVDDLDALHRGGRIPASVAFAGSKLDVKPLLCFDLEGKLTVSGVARGRKKGLRAMYDFYKKGQDPNSPHVVYIGNADCPRDAEHLGALIRETDRTCIVNYTDIGPTIGSHVGPGMVSCCFWGADRRESVSISDRIARKVKKS